MFVVFASWRILNDEAQLPQAATAPRGIESSDLPPRKEGKLIEKKKTLRKSSYRLDGVEPSRVELRALPLLNLSRETA